MTSDWEPDNYWNKDNVTEGGGGSSLDSTTPSTSLKCGFIYIQVYNFTGSRFHQWTTAQSKHRIFYNLNGWFQFKSLNPMTLDLD